MELLCPGFSVVNRELFCPCHGVKGENFYFFLQTITSWRRCCCCMLRHSTTQQVNCGLRLLLLSDSTCSTALYCARSLIILWIHRKRRRRRGLSCTRMVLLSTSKRAGNSRRSRVSPTTQTVVPTFPKLASTLLCSVFRLPAESQSLLDLRVPKISIDIAVLRSVRRGKIYTPTPLTRHATPNDTL